MDVAHGNRGGVTGMRLGGARVGIFEPWLSATTRRLIDSANCLWKLLPVPVVLLVLLDMYNSAGRILLRTVRGQNIVHCSETAELSLRVWAVQATLIMSYEESGSEQKIRFGRRGVNVVVDQRENCRIALFFPVRHSFLLW
ncbi:hypothetical protein IRJ41_013311, partial [Triplophysa rosa]